MNISAKSIWKIVTNHESLFSFPKFGDTEWILAKSQLHEKTEEFEMFLKSLPIGPDDQIILIEGPHDISELSWRTFVEKHDHHLVLGKNIWLSNLSLDWLFVYNAIGVAKFGKRIQVELPQNIG